MKSFRFLSRQASFGIAAVALLVGVVAPGLVPAFASADTITDRQVILSQSAPSATSTYEFKFTTASAATNSFKVTFSTEAVDGSAPSGFAIPASFTGATGATVTGSSNTITAVLTSPVAADTAVDVTVPGFTNPTDAGTIYAQISTYASDDGTGTALDSGTVAIAISDDIAVGGSVLETLSFCASAATITSCSSVTPPTVQFETLESNAVATGTIYSQLSTNAASGAVVSIKSNTTGCGGLVRAGADTNAHGCGITPETTAAAIAAGDAKFGMRLSDSNTDTTFTLPTGVTAVGNYNASTDYFNYVSGDATGVTSTYGDQIYGTTAPINAANVPLTFDASISNTTPAGDYSADLNLIASGTF